MRRGQIFYYRGYPVRVVSSKETAWGGIKVKAESDGPEWNRGDIMTVGRSGLRGASTARLFYTRENPVKRGVKKVTKSPLLYAGLIGAGVVAAIIFWPKKASAATSSFQQTSSGGGPLPSPPKPTPAPVAPVKGEVIISQGSTVKLLAPLRARFGGDYVTVPAGTTLSIDRVDADGTIWFQYNGQLLSSPVEDYTAVV